MNIYTHNFNINSDSGPNKFTRQLMSTMIRNQKVNLTSKQNANVEFCLIQQDSKKEKPMLLRLDGIWFNSEQDYRNQNAPIEYSYKNSDAVVFQSNFNKKLTESWFGEHHNSHVIHNAADHSFIKSIEKYPVDFSNIFEKDCEVWTCASSWRPHKRLRENIRYFLEFAPKNAKLAIAGKGVEPELRKEFNDKRINFLGDLMYPALVALYLRSTTFIHLSYLDHCPNVVVDAQAAGCKIICSSTGGTSEIIESGTVVIEDEWDFKPCKLYKPPAIKFDSFKHYSISRNRTIVNCAKRYFDVLQGII